MKNRFDDIIELLRRHKVGMIPCAENEVQILEEYLHCSLPQAYREYLLSMGKYSGRINAGTDCFYSDLFNLKPAAIELLATKKVEKNLPSDAVVFSMHQGYEFDFFRRSEGDNPPVYSYSEGDVTANGFRRTSDSFTEYFKMVLNAYNIR
jgi:hypothetical protein